MKLTKLFLQSYEQRKKTDLVENYLPFGDLFTYTHIAEINLFTPFSGKIHLTSKN
jgi:hypothetical protein